MTSSKPNYLPKTPNTITLGVRASSYEFSAGTVLSVVVESTKCWLVKLGSFLSGSLSTGRVPVRSVCLTPSRCSLAHYVSDESTGQKDGCSSLVQRTLVTSP